MRPDLPATLPADVPGLKDMYVGDYFDDPKARKVWKIDLSVMHDALAKSAHDDDDGARSALSADATPNLGPGKAYTKMLEGI